MLKIEKISKNKIGFLFHASVRNQTLDRDLR